MVDEGKKEKEKIHVMVILSLYLALCGQNSEAARPNNSGSFTAMLGNIDGAANSAVSDYSDGEF